MLLRILSWFSTLVLIAVFFLTFKFSIDSIEEHFLKAEVEDIIGIKKQRILNRLSLENKEVLAALPCQKPKDCIRAAKIRDIVKDERKNSKIDYISFFNADGENLFDGKLLSSKYIDLIRNYTDSTYLEENISSDKEKRRVAFIKPIDDSKNKVFIFAIMQAKNVSVYATIYYVCLAALFALPLLYIMFYYSYNSRLNRELAENIAEDLEEVNEKYDTLKRENLQQSNFLANFTHELRTPLNSIIGFSGLLKDQTLGDLGNPEYVKYSNDINTAGIHLLSLINDILDYTKAEVGRLKVGLTEVDIVKVIRQCMAIVSPRASESGVELLQSITSKHMILRLDQKRIKQVILNLLSNAVKFTPEGGNVTISVFPDIKGERVYVEVKDTGVGIEEKDVPRVMSLFGQVESDLNRKYEGTGIGLPFSKKLTNMMSGTFELTSKVNMGTRVTLGFPFDKKMNAEFINMIDPKN